MTTSMQIMTIAVVEAKELGLPAEGAVQQARECAEILGLKFAWTMRFAAWPAHRGGSRTVSRTRPCRSG
jgi:hypothetical protein